MSAYTDAAPDLSKAVTLTKFKRDNPAPVRRERERDVKPTLAQTRAVYNALLSLESTGIGISGVVRLTGVSARWVRRIHRQMHAASGAVWES
jgi:hypothetical protein